jgi:transposase
MQPEARRRRKKLRFVGIDIDKGKCRAAITYSGGFMLEEFTFTNNHEGIEGLSSKLIAR